jgi:uncharacterized protein YbbK (DUF523 family)
MSKHIEIVVSACLAGIPCRYNGEASPNQTVMELVEQGRAIPVCPEVLAGLPTPRESAEQIGDKVFTKTGEDMTDIFKKGAQIALAIALGKDCDEAILKSRSPSCGSGKVYDGTFSGNLIDGDGVFAEALKASGITVYTEESFDN